MATEADKKATFPEGAPEFLEKHFDIFGSGEYGLLCVEEDKDASPERRFYCEIEADWNDDVELIKKLGATLKEDSRLASYVRSVYYAGNTDWGVEVCENLIRPCPNLEDLKSMTTAGDWLDIIPTKSQLRRLYLYTSGDHRFAGFTLPKLLATLQHCPNLEELRITGNFITRHTKEDSARILKTSKITCPNFYSLALISVDANAEDVRYLRELLPSISNLELGVDAQEPGIVDAINKCFKQWSSITRLTLRPARILPIELDFSPLTELITLNTNNHLIQPSALRSLSSLKKLNYVARDVFNANLGRHSDVKGLLVEHLRDVSNLPSLHKLKIEAEDYGHAGEFEEVATARNINLEWWGVGVRYHTLRGTFFEEVEKGLTTPPASPIDEDDKIVEVE